MGLCLTGRHFFSLPAQSCTSPQCNADDTSPHALLYIEADRWLYVVCIRNQAFFPHTVFRSTLAFRMRIQPFSRPNRNQKPITVNLHYNLKVSKWFTVGCKLLVAFDCYRRQYKRHLDSFTSPYESNGNLLPHFYLQKYTKLVRFYCKASSPRQKELASKKVTTSH